MKLTLTTPVLDHDDQPIMENGKIVTMGTALQTALLADKPDTTNKSERFDLWLKLKTAVADTDFSVAEVALLDKAIAFYPTLIFGRLSHFLSNKNN